MLQKAVPEALGKTNSLAHGNALEPKANVAVKHAVKTVAKPAHKPALPASQDQ